MPWSRSRAGDNAPAGLHPKRSGPACRDPFHSCSATGCGLLPSSRDFSPWTDGTLLACRVPDTHAQRRTIPRAVQSAHRRVAGRADALACPCAPRLCRGMAVGRGARPRVRVGPVARPVQPVPLAVPDRSCPSAHSCSIGITTTTSPVTGGTGKPCGALAKNIGLCTLSMSAAAHFLGHARPSRAVLVLFTVFSVAGLYGKDRLSEVWLRLQAARGRNRRAIVLVGLRPSGPPSSRPCCARITRCASTSSPGSERRRSRCSSFPTSCTPIRSSASSSPTRRRRRPGWRRRSWRARLPAWRRGWPPTPR